MVRGRSTGSTACTGRSGKRSTARGAALALAPVAVLTALGAASPTAAVAPSPVAAAAASCPQPRLDVLSAPQRTSTATLATGVTARRFWATPREGDQLQLTVVTADLRKARLVPVHPALAGRIASTGTLASAVRALAAVNGDFFAMGTSRQALTEGVQVSGGVRYAPAGGGPYVGTDAAGNLQAGTHAVRGVAQVLNPSTRAVTASLPVTAVNAEAAADSVAVYTPVLDAANPRRGDWQVLVRRGVVSAGGGTLTTDLTRLPAADQAVVLAGRGTAGLALKRLKAGTPLVWTASVVDAATGVKLGAAIGSGPRVLTNGAVAGPCQLSYRSRTMVAWSDDRVRLWLVTLNSKQITANSPGHGATYRQLGMIAAELGASQAVLLDGGGSTTLTARSGGKLVRLDADPNRYQREVANGLGLVAR